MTGLMQQIKLLELENAYLKNHATPSPLPRYVILLEYQLEATCLCFWWQWEGTAVSYSNENFSFKFELPACLFPSAEKRVTERGVKQAILI